MSPPLMVVACSQAFNDDYDYPRQRRRKHLLHSPSNRARAHLVSRAWLLAGERHSPYKVCGVQLFSVGRVGEQGW